MPRDDLLTYLADHRLCSNGRPSNLPLLSRQSNSAFRSGRVTHMAFEKQVADQLRLLLAPVQVAAHARHELGAGGRAALAHGIGLDVLVEQLGRG